MFLEGLVPELSLSNLSYVIAIMGGVGGTLTILSYSYWMQEKKVEGLTGLKTTRTDLKLSYCLTALFSISMIILGAQLKDYTGDKSMFPIYISELYWKHFGVVGKYIFLLGFWSGVFSSLLGVWQSVPYLFTDLISSKFELRNRNKIYNLFAIYMATFPIISLWVDFEKIQVAYAIIGALFMPFLAFTLLFLLRGDELGKYDSKIIHKVMYITTFLIFGFFGFYKFLK